MGTIVSSRIREDGKVVYEVVVDSSESLQLKGHMADVHIFSLNNMETHSRLTKRGTNDATTYLLVPKEYREGLKESANAKCQIIRIPNKRIFLFAVDDF
jgi:hypothetical protein